MKLLFIDEYEEVMEIDFIRYEMTKEKEEAKNSFYLHETIKYYVRNISNDLRKFVNSVYETHVYVLFDDSMVGRVKKIYSPSIEIGDKYIKVEKLKVISI